MLVDAPRDVGGRTSQRDRLAGDGHAVERASLVGGHAAELAEAEELAVAGHQGPARVAGCARELPPLSFAATAAADELEGVAVLLTTDDERVRHRDVAYESCEALRGVAVVCGRGWIRTTVRSVRAAAGQHLEEAIQLSRIVLIAADVAEALEAELGLVLSNPQ